MTRSSSRIIVLTNDDGVDAPGLAALAEAVEGLGQARVVAPFGPYSGCGHVVTTHAPITITATADGRTAVVGSPADCVRVALARLVPDFDWVISGINAGGNLGADVHHSGTVAAVREAAIHGRPGIAISHYIAKGRVIDWGRAARWSARVLGELIGMGCEPGTFWNVNLPHPGADSDDPESVFCALDPSPLPLAYRFDPEGIVAHYAGDYQSRRRKPGADVDVCFGGRIAKTLVRVW